VSIRGGVNAALPVPINGNIIFGYTPTSTSTLALETDLTFASTAGTSSTTIKINTTTGSASIDGRNGTIFFSGDTYLPNSRALNILSNLTIDGKDHDIVFGQTFTFTVPTGVTLSIRNASLRNLQTLNFVGAGRVALYNVEIALDNNWTYSGNASIGTPELYFGDNIRIDGKNKSFIFSGGRNFLLSSDAVVTFDPTVTFSWACNRRYGLSMDNSETGIPYTTAVPGAILYFNGSNFYVPSHGPFNGLNLKNGNVFFENSCNIYNESNTAAARSLQLGDASSSANNTDVIVLSGAQVYVDGYVYDASV
jgi:hypothetical protein